MRFLIKAPIVGIKVFDGETVKKRLQLTFESEGNFNMFANKVRQWLGINVQGTSFAENANSQMESSQLSAVLPPSQPVTGSTPGTISMSQPMTGGQSASIFDQSSSSFMSQPLAKPLSLTMPFTRSLSQNLSSTRSLDRSLSQNIPVSTSMSQNVPTTTSLSQSLASSQRFEPLTQPTGMSSQLSQPKSALTKIAPEAHSESILASRLLAEFSEAIDSMPVNQTNQPKFSQQHQFLRDLLSYPSYTDPVSLLLNAAEMANDDRTQYSQQDTMFQSTQIEFNDTQTSMISPDLRISKVANNAYNSQAITEEEIENAMADSSVLNSKRRSRKRNRKSVSGSKFEAKIAGAIKEVIHSNDDSIHDLSDNHLALKLCRVMKSRSFLRLVKRVDSLLQSLPDDTE